MTTEAVLLLGLFAFLIMGAFLGDNGPRATFLRSGPRLGARIEKHLSTGRGFNIKGGPHPWIPPAGGAPDGSFQ